MSLYLTALFLWCTLWSSHSLDDSYLVGKAHCADFNHAVYKGSIAQLQHAYVCPALDGIAGTYCKDPFPTKNARDIFPSSLTWDDILFYILIGPRSNVDPLRWWLQFVKDKIDMVFVADACADGTTECADSAQNIVDTIAKEYPLVHTHLQRALPGDSGYNILSCKLRTGQKLIYTKFPDRKYYFKFDTDTILFPRRLLSFFHTIDAVAENGHKSPLYFGTMVESGIPQLLCKHHTHGSAWTFPEKNASICYCQGGAGYGLSNPVMRHMAAAPSCAIQAPSDLPEDLYTALEVYNNFNHTVPIHCGGFRSSELVNDEWFKQSISFHYIDAKWLRTHGHKLISHYHDQQREHSAAAVH
jgi:hypothetical protein